MTKTRGRLGAYLLRTLPAAPQLTLRERLLKDSRILRLARWAAAWMLGGKQ